MKEYPRDMQSVLTLYAQGYSLADYLVQNGGKARYLQFLEDAHRRDWNVAIKSFYGLKGVEDLETRWNGWVVAGSPSLGVPEGGQLADAGAPATQDPELTIRSQNPEAPGTPEPQALLRKDEQPRKDKQHKSGGEERHASPGHRAT